MSNQLQQQPAVQGLLRYGTFAGKEERNSTVINVEDISSEEESNDETAEEANYARCGGSCTLF